MIVTLSPNNDKILQAIKLKQKKYRDESKLFLVEGRHLVEEAAANKCLLMAFATDMRYLKGIQTESYLVASSTMKKMALTVTPQGIIGIAKQQINKDLNYKRYLLLDDISDPGNLGTIIRTAAAFSIEAIILSPNTVDVYNEKVVRSTQGMLFQIPLITKDLKEAVQELKEKGIFIYATVVNGATPIKKAPKKAKMAIILGNESRGISNDLLSFVDIPITIPMASTVESLNVGIAGAIVMYELIK